MSLDDAAILAAWSVLLVIFVATMPRFRVGRRLERPEPQPLLLDPLSLDLDGPVIDLEPA